MASPFALGVVGTAALALVAGLWRRRRPAPLPRRDRATPVVFLLALGTLVARHQWLNPHWVCHGADWDTWLQSVAALGSQTPWPHLRWPLYGALARLVAALVPGPLFRDVQLASLLATAGTVAAVHRLGRGLVGRAGALAAAGLALASPLLLVVGSWTSGYALWGCAAAWAVAGGAEALRTGRPRAWGVAGLGTAGVFATLPKGLGLGLGLLGLFGLAALLTGRRGPARLGAFLAPLALCALAYAAFPGELQSLDAHIASVEAAAARGPGPGPGRVGGAPGDTTAAATGGYVFGKAMAPATVLGALARAGALVDPATRDRRLGDSLATLRTAFPQAGPVGLGLFGAGALLGLLTALARREGRLAGWLGVLGAVATAGPALFSHLNLRFLVPAAGLGVLPLVALVALPARHAGRWGRGLPLLLLGVAALPGSPWIPGPTLPAWTPPTFQQEVRAHQVLFQVRPLVAGRRVHGIGPAALLLPTVADAGGTLAIPEPGAPAVHFGEADLLLRWVQGIAGVRVGAGLPVSATGAPLPTTWTGLGGRRVLLALPMTDMGEGLVLLGPVE